MGRDFLAKESEENDEWELFPEAVREWGLLPEADANPAVWASFGSAPKKNYLLMLVS